MQARKTEEKRKKLVWQNAMYDASLQNGFLRVCWDESMKTISPIIYDFGTNFGMPLKALRLIGIGLTELPEDFAPSLRNLEVLSLANNGLTSLPENIATLTQLRELNIMYNKMKSLPQRIGFMCSLQKLGVANNELQALPVTFGALNLIERVDLEHNQLSVLPENLDNLVSCKMLNVNNNKLIRLPRCVGRMPSLTSLSASCNALTYIPSQLPASTTLVCLRLNVNQISVLPDRLGDLTQLQELNLDYNRIGKLPVSFWKLASLTVLRIEGNDSLLDPPPEVLGRGGAEVVKYCRAIHMNDGTARMRETVLAMQNVLRQIQERDLADAAYFEADVKRGEKDLDRWFAVQLPYLWRDLVPQLKSIWEAERAKAKKNRKALSDDVTTFDYTEQEVMQAFTTYADAVGPILRVQKTMFKRCACVDAQGQRVPCVPPMPGYMCLRDCVLLKKDLVRQREKHDRLWNAYKSDGMQDAMKRAEYEAKLYLDSAEGQLWLEDTAYEQAEDVLLESGANAAVEGRYQDVEYRKKQVVLKYDKKKERVQKTRDQKIKQLETSLEKLKEDRRLAKEGYVRSAVEQRIQNVTVKLANLPETAELQQLQDDCERDCAQLDAGLYESDSVNTSEVGSSDFSTDDESPEALRWRERLRRRDEAESKRIRMKQVKARFDVKVEVGKGLLAQAAHIADVFVVKPVMEPISAASRQANKVHKKVRRAVRQAVEVATIRAKKLYLKSNGHFDEVQKELKYEIYRQYMDHHVQIAKDKARHEFTVIESVRTNMEGMGRDKAFRAWKFWVVTKKRRLRKDLRKQWKMATRGFDAAMHSVTSAQFQVDLWIKNKDIYTDQVYWRNEVNGNITYDKPGLHHYLPPNFSIPVPPADLPDDIPLQTSSSEDSSAEGWLQRYEAKRRKKKAQQTLLDLALHSKQSGDSSGSSRSSSDGEAGSFAESESIGRNLIQQSGVETNTTSASQYGQFDSNSISGPNGQMLLQNGEQAGDVKESARSSQSGSSGSGSSESSSGSSGSGESESQSHSQSQSQADSQSQSQSQSNASVSVNTKAISVADSALDGTAQNLSALGLGDAAAGTIGIHSVDTYLPQSGYAANEAAGGSDQYYYSEQQQDQQVQQYQEGQVWEGGEDPYSQWVWDYDQQVWVARVPADGQGYAQQGAETVVATAEPQLQYQEQGQALVEQKGTEQQLAVPQVAPKVAAPAHYEFRKKLQEYNHVFDENEEVYVGVAHSKASAKLQEAVDLARAYMQSNQQYLLQNQLKAIGGGKAPASKKVRSGKSMKRITDDADAGAVAAQAIDLYAKPSDIKEDAAVIKHKAWLEYEAAFKAIRKKRNQLNPERHHTYMRQVNRKPKSLEMHKAELLAAAPQAGSEEELIQQLNAFMDGAVTKDGEFRPPTEEELLKLAGGDANMVYTGKAGMELRTVLAQRALHVKKRLEKQAVERHLIAPKASMTFWGREIKPLFMDKYKGSSSEEEDADEDGNARKAKEIRRKLRRERRADRAFMSQKLGGST